MVHIHSFSAKNWLLGRYACSSEKQGDVKTRRPYVRINWNVNVIYLFTLNELGNREISCFNPQYPCVDFKLCSTVFRLTSFTNYAYSRDSMLLGFRITKLDFQYGLDQTNLQLTHASKNSKVNNFF